MFRYEKVPPEMTHRSKAWYVVDRDRDLWLRSLGTNGPRGDRVFVLCVRGRKVSLEVDTNGRVDGLPTDQITTFGHSWKAEFSDGIPMQNFPDPDERFALQELAAEALLVLDAGERARYGLTPGAYRVALSAGDYPVYQLADFGYDDEMFAAGVSTD